MNLYKQGYRNIVKYVQIAMRSGWMRSTSRDTENWCNEAENVGLITEINILQYITIEKPYFKL